MLNHVDLPSGLRECYRVLKPGGTMFIYMTQATELCEPKETARICAAQAIVLENMSPRTLETTAQAAGFILADSQVIGSEWREAALESGEDKDSLAEDLLRISRMRRQEADLVEKYGKARYEAAYTEAHWFLYILLGKLNPTVYILRKPDLR
jgi:ubiquinone/menaquinone biosynthesis C-methylase UbiE